MEDTPTDEADLQLEILEEEATSLNVILSQFPVTALMIR